MQKWKNYNFSNILQKVKSNYLPISMILLLIPIKFEAPYCRASVYVEVSTSSTFTCKFPNYQTKDGSSQRGWKQYCENLLQLIRVFFI
jgi:hypothetical protein